MPQIVLDNICKSFYVKERPEGKFGVVRGIFSRKTKVVEALKNITFSIDESELIGYIGPNGAGKSTTVKIMSGILTPESGQCQILDRTPWKNRVKHVAQIGVVFGQRSQLWWDVPVDDSFEILRDIYGVEKLKFKKRLDELVDVLNISEYIHTPVRQLSLGQRMRCEIAASLLHSPQILFLDEPTIGLDAVSKLNLRKFLKHENKNNGVTMILTTHDMEDIKALCSRVMVIGKGELLYDGTLQKLKTKYSPLRCISTHLSYMPNDIQIENAIEINTEENKCNIWFDPKQIEPHLMSAIVAEKLPITDILIKEKDIDEIIASMYKELSL